MIRKSGCLCRVSGLRLLVVAAWAAGALSLPAASAAASGLTVTPAKPRVGQAITLHWRQAAPVPRGKHLYFVARLLNATGPGCAATARVSVRRSRVRPGRDVAVPLTPPSGVAWCAGSWEATEQLVNGAGMGAGPRHLLTFTMLRADGTQAGTPVKIAVLTGSTETVSAAGRSDRTAAVSGTLTGEIPATFRPNTDITTSITAGALTLTGLPADSQCTPDGAAEPRAFPVADGAGSSATLHASGHVDLTLVVRRDLFSFTGCLPAALTPTTGATSLTLSGQVGSGGLSSLTLTGNAGPLALAGVGDATVALKLVVSIDLSGKG